MKRLFALVLLLIFSFSAFAANQNKEGVSGIIFDKTLFDFGEVVRENKNYTCTFIVENKGDKPLVLLSVNTSCSCLKAAYSRRPLKVGEKTSITMTLEAAKMDLGLFHRVIEVHTNVGISHIVVRGNSVSSE